MKQNYVRQALILIKEQLGADLSDCDDIGTLNERYAEALWLEERYIDRVAAGIGKAFGGDKNNKNLPRNSGRHVKRPKRRG